MSLIDVALSGVVLLLIGLPLVFVERFYTSKIHTCDGMFFCRKCGEMYCEHGDCLCWDGGED